MPTDVPHADATATVAVEDNAGVVAPGAPPGDIPSAPTEITDSTVVADAQPADGGPAESEASPD